MPVEKIMSKTSDVTSECELTIDELEHVSGGKPGNTPLEYLKITMKEAIVTSV